MIDALLLLVVIFVIKSKILVTIALIYTLLCRLQGPVTSVAFSPDGTLIASGSLDHSLKIWDVLSGIMVGSVIDHTDGINYVKFSYDSQKVMTASNDQTVRLFDVATELLTPIENTFDSLFEGSKNIVNSVAFSPEGSKIVSTSSNDVLIWDVSTRELVKALKGHEDTVLSASYNTSNSKLCSCAKDGSVMVWDTLTYEVIATLTSCLVSSAVFTLDGYKVVLRSADYKVSFWDYFSGGIIHEFCNPRQIYRQDPYQVNLVTFSPEGLLKTISIVNARINVDGIDVDDESKQEIQLWDVVSNELISTLEPHPLCSAVVEDVIREESNDASKKPLISDDTPALSRSFSFSPDGLIVAVGYTDGAIIVSNVMSGISMMNLRGHTSTVTSLCFNIEGTRMVSGSEDCSLKLWDIHGGVLITTLKGHRDTVTHVTFSPCGLQVASASKDKTLMLWDAVDINASSPEPSREDEQLDTSGAPTTEEKVFVSQMAAVIGKIEEVVDPEDEFLTEDEKRIKSYRFQYVDGW
jgi:WD40 repeat protein